MHSFSDAVVLDHGPRRRGGPCPRAGEHASAGAGRPNRSQTFMRWRVGLQFLAIVAIVIVLYFRRH